MREDWDYNVRSIERDIAMAEAKWEFIENYKDKYMPDYTKNANQIFAVHECFMNWHDELRAGVTSELRDLRRALKAKDIGQARDMFRLISRAYFESKAEEEAIEIWEGARDVEEPDD